jgi:hypothetical protein
MQLGGFFMMSDNSKLTGNTALNNTSSGGDGGGIMIVGTFVMKDFAEISGNTAWGTSRGSGAGVCQGGTFRFGGGIITGCDGTHDPSAHDPSNPAARDSCNVNWNGAAVITTYGAAYYKYSGTAQYGPVNDSGAFVSGGTALDTSESTIHVVSGVLQ